jgi:CBS domain-containing protein
MSTQYSDYGPVNGHLAARLPEDGRLAARLKSDLSARDLMSVCTATLRPEDSIERAARLMSESDSSPIPVVDRTGRLLGILTDRDITVKLIARGSSVPHAQVSDCMTSEAFACSAGSSLESCMRAMSWHQVRRIPIVDDDHRVVGILSQGDIARYACEHAERVARSAMINILWSLAY